MRGGNLDTRAVRYYNFMAGRSPQTDYGMFLSPAYLQQMQRSELEEMNQAVGAAKRASERYPEITPANCAFSKDKDGKYAYSVVDPRLGDAYAHLAPVRWVRVGFSWYIYLGSDAEIQRYGQFPSSLGPPEPPETDADPQSTPATAASADAEQSS